MEEAAQIYALPVSDLSQRLSVTGTYFVVHPSSNCTAAFGLLSLACPSLPLLSVSDSGLHYLTLPATAPFGSAFALSIAFTNLAALEVALVNVSVGKFLLFHRSCRCVSLFDATHVLPRLDAGPLCLWLFRPMFLHGLPRTGWSKVKNSTMCISYGCVYCTQHNHSHTICYVFLARNREETH